MRSLDDIAQITDSNVYWETNNLMTTHGFQVLKYAPESILCYHS